MKIISLLILSSLAIFGLAACGGGSTGTMNNANTNGRSNGAIAGNSTANMSNSNMTNSNMNTGNSTSGMSKVESEFLTEAAEGGMAEVELGKLAASKGASAEVKDFGNRMVADHTKANNDLKALATKKNVTLPTETNAKQKADMEELQKLSGAAFDSKYVKMMVEDHEKNVAEFRKQSESSADPDVKAFAAKTLPTLQSHLQTILNIRSKTK